MTFIRDLKAGQTAEEEFVELLQSYGLRAGRNTATNQREMALYDVWDENYQTYEIKLDRRAEETGNIYFEHECLSHSNAHFIVYKVDVDNKFYIIDRESLLSHIHNPKYKVVSGGDKWGKGTLIPVDEFRTLFKDCQDAFQKAYPKKKTIKKIPSKKA